MNYRLFIRSGLIAMALLMAVESRQVIAQQTPAVPPTSEPQLIRRPDWEAALNPGLPPAQDCSGRWDFGITAGPGGYYHSGWPYGPRVAPPWGYPFLWDGPFVGYPWGWPGYDPWGWYGYSGRAGHNWSNGLSLYGPPVPTYGPVPGIIGNNDLVRQWRDVPSLGIGYGWFGVYSAWPKNRHPSVSVWPVIESVPAPMQPVPAPEVPEQAASLVISVKVPQPAAEVIVDGVKTAQTGTDRLFESPPLEAGKRYQYEITVRWIEGGQTREMKKAVTGTPGEVVRVDFTRSD